CPVAVPRTVMVVGPPTVAPAAAVSVRTDASVVVLFGLNAPVTPAGSPSTANGTAPAKPFVRVSATFAVAVALCVMSTVAGVTASVYELGVGAGTLSWNVAVLSVCPVAVLRTVTVVGPPTVAPAAAVSVSVDAFVVVLFGANAPVTPAGSPST